MYCRIGKRVLWVRVATTAIPAHRPVVLDQLGELRCRAVERVVEPLFTGLQVEDPARSEAHEPRLRKGGNLRQKGDWRGAATAWCEARGGSLGAGGQPVPD